MLQYKKIHFIGIGGIGMSGLAQILLKSGHIVTGSDTVLNESTRKIESLGGKVFLGHNPSNIEDADLVVYSSALSESNPEILTARARGLKVIKRGQMLAEMMKGKTGIVIAGAHGKTTTTSMICTILKKSGLEPTFAIGGEVNDFGGNASLGKGEYFVAEADESDGSFLYLAPKYSVVTNIDDDHMDYYKTSDNLTRAYVEFINKTEDGGVLFCCGDDARTMSVLQYLKVNHRTFGLSHESDIHAEAVEIAGLESKFCCFYKGKILGAIHLRIPGIHNVSNSLAAVGVGMELGLPFNKIASALDSYKGADRRFQIKGTIRGITIVDDYAHHPAEIKATLLAAKNLGYNRLVVVFQPHRYTRTMYFKDSFGKSFSLADHLVLTDIYSASEVPLDGVSARDIYDKAIEYGHKDVRLLPKEAIVEYLVNVLKTGDLVLVLGAGDIVEVSAGLMENLKKSL